MKIFDGEHLLEATDRDYPRIFARVNAVDFDTFDYLVVGLVDSFPVGIGNRRKQ